MFRILIRRGVGANLHAGVLKCGIELPETGRTGLHHAAYIARFAPVFESLPGCADVGPGAIPGARPIDILIVGDVVVRPRCGGAFRVPKGRLPEVAVETEVSHALIVGAVVQFREDRSRSGPVVGVPVVMPTGSAGVFHHATGGHTERVIPSHLLHHFQ